jgi:transcriptional regulator with XRE-family HTH domain
MNKRKANAFDASLGRCIRAARRQAELTQTDLAVHLGVTYQQVQKYERGTNQMTAGRMCEIAELCGVPPMELLEDALTAPVTS